MCHADKAATPHSSGKGSASKKQQQRPVIVSSSSDSDTSISEDSSSSLKQHDVLSDEVLDEDFHSVDGEDDVMDHDLEDDLMELEADNTAKPQATPARQSARRGLSQTASPHSVTPRGGRKRTPAKKMGHLNDM